MAGVTSSYPAALDSESNLTPPNNGDTLSVADHWLAGNAGPIVKIETELGTDPAGTFTDVKSRLDSGLVTQADIWRLTASKTSENTVISANLERADDASSGLLGTGMTESSGVFSFPETGIYQVLVQGYFAATSVPDNMLIATEVTINNSSYDIVSYCANRQTSSGGDSGSYSQCVIDVTDTANVKVRFSCLQFNTGNGLYGNTDINTTCFSFIRLGGT